MNDLSHSEHLNGRSPVWSRLCRLSEELDERERWQMEHWYRVEVFLLFNGRDIPTGPQSLLERSGDSGKPRLSRRTILDLVGRRRGEVLEGETDFPFLSFTSNSTLFSFSGVVFLLAEGPSFPLLTELPKIGCRLLYCCSVPGKLEAPLVRLMTGLLMRLPEHNLRGTFTIRELQVSSSPSPPTPQSCCPWPLVSSSPAAD